VGGHYTAASCLGKQFSLSVCHKIKPLNLKIINRSM